MTNLARSQPENFGRFDHTRLPRFCITSFQAEVILFLESAEKKNQWIDQNLYFCFPSNWLQRCDHVWLLRADSFSHCEWGHVGFGAAMDTRPTGLLPGLLNSQYHHKEETGMVSTPRPVAATVRACECSHAATKKLPWLMIYSCLDTDSLCNHSAIWQVWERCVPTWFAKQRSYHVGGELCPLEGSCSIPFFDFVLAWS